MDGKIIVIEGVDSVGKHTQALALQEKLKKDGYKVYLHSFPTYEEEQSTLVKMFLSGKFGENVDCVNYKVASSFFAVDRVATYHLTLKQKLSEGYILILDRYTTSNMVHQAGKFKTKKEILKSVKWIEKYEFDDLELPRPDVVLYLTLDQSVRESLLDKRRNDEEKDIDEKDKSYLEKVSKAGLMVCQEYNWNLINCSKNNSLRTIEDISAEIYKIIKEKIGD